MTKAIPSYQEEDQMSRKKAIITDVTLRVDGGLILPGMPEDSSMASGEKGW